MKTRPRIFVIYSLVLSLVALSLPIQASVITGRGFFNLLDGFLMLTPLNIVVLSLCLITASLSLNASPGLKLCMPLLLIAVSLNNYAIFKSQISFEPMQVAWATAIFALAHVPLMFGPAKRALLNPRTRWWLVPQRRLLDLSVNIKTIQGFRFSSRSFDVSEGGLYLQIDPMIFNNGQSSLVKNMIAGGRMTLRLAVGRFQEIKCEAQVVRCQVQDQGQYPAGIGLRFINVNRKTKSDLTRLLRSHFTQQSRLRI